MKTQTSTLFNGPKFGDIFVVVEDMDVYHGFSDLFPKCLKKGSVILFLRKNKRFDDEIVIFHKNKIMYLPIINLQRELIKK